MASSADIFVAFGADTGGLEAAMALAKAETAAFQRQVTGLAKDMKATGDAADSELGKKFQAASVSLKAAKEQAASFASQLKGTGDAAPALAHGVEQVTAAVSHGHTGIGFYLRELHALSDEFGSGRTRQGIGTLSNLIFTFLQSNAQWIPYAAAVAALGGAFGYVAYQAYETSKAVKSIEFDAAINQFTLTREASAQLLASVERLGNVGASDAAEFIEPFLKLGPVGEAISAVASHYLPAFTAAGKDAKVAGEDMAKMFADVTKGGGEVIANSRVLTEEEKRKAQAFIASGDTVGAYRYVLDILSRSLTGVASEAAKAKADTDEMRAKMAAGVLTADSLASAEDLVAAALANSTSKMQGNEEELGRWALKAAMATDQAGRLAAAMRDALKVDKTSADIKDLEGKVKEFQDALGVAKDPASIAQLNRSLDIASDKLKKARQEFDAGLGGGDSVSNLQRQFKIDDSSFKGADADRLRQHDVAMRLLLSSDTLTAEQRKKLEEDVATNAKAIRDADNASFLRQDEIKVAAAGKNSAAVIALREAEVQREIAIYGVGSREAEAAEDRLARAKEKAAERGAKAGEKAARDELGATEEGIKGQIKALEDAEKMRADHESALVKLHKESAEKSATDTVAALTKEKAAVDALYDHEAQLAGLTATKKQAILDEEASFNDQIALKIQEANEKAAEATTKAWQKGADQISGALNGQWRSILSGQENWGTAARKIFADWVLEGIQDATKLAVNVISQYVLMGNAATLSGAVQAAAQQTAAAGGISALVANAVKAVTIDAGQTFAGVAAFLSPFLGPAALGPAAAAEATVMGAVASADIGMWQVPSDQLAMIHKNELIMPAAEAGALRSMLSNAAAGGGGGAAGGVTHNHNWNINAVDAGGVRAWFHDNASHVASALHKAVSNGDHYGLKALGAR